SASRRGGGPQSPTDFGLHQPKDPAALRETIVSADLRGTGDDQGFRSADRHSRLYGAQLYRRRSGYALERRFHGFENRGRQALDGSPPDPATGFPPPAQNPTSARPTPRPHQHSP